MENAREYTYKINRTEVCFIAPESSPVAKSSYYASWTLDDKNFFEVKDATSVPLFYQCKVVKCHSNHGSAQKCITKLQF